ncbi:MAG: hypothetical protein AAGI23_02770 [Bacteroidota bacterium]
MLKGKKQGLFDDVGIYETRLSLGIFKSETDQKIVAILTNTTAKRSRKTYKERWSIKVFFQSIKKRGFNLERTHMKEPERIRKLMLLASLAFVLSLVIDIYVHLRIRKILIKKHSLLRTLGGYKAVGYARKGIDTIRENLKLNQSIKRICNYLFDLIAKRWQLYQHQLLVFVG